MRKLIAIIAAFLLYLPNTPLALGQTMNPVVVTSKPPAAAGGTVTYVKDGEGFCSGCTTNSFSLPATTGSGHILLIGDAGNTSSTVGISSITCTGCAGSAAWVTPAGCTGAGTAAYVSCAYVISSAIISSVTINWSGSAATHIWWYYEYSCSATASYDTSGFTNNGNAAANPQPGVALTLSGASYLIFQTAAEYNALQSISSPYGHFNTDGTIGQGWATSENTTSGTAPNWTLLGANQLIVNALAIKCQ